MIKLQVKLTTYPHPVREIYPGFSLIGRASTLLRSHWSLASFRAWKPLLCHKEPVESKKFPFSGALETASGSIWHKSCRATL